MIFDVRPQSNTCKSIRLLETLALARPRQTQQTNSRYTHRLLCIRYQYVWGYDAVLEDTRTPQVGADGFGVSVNFPDNEPLTANDKK